jgi:hypothetical protein
VIYIFMRRLYISYNKKNAISLLFDKHLYIIFVVYEIHKYTSKMVEHFNVRIFEMILTDINST